LTASADPNATPSSLRLSAIPGVLARRIGAAIAYAAQSSRQANTSDAHGLTIEQLIARYRALTPSMVIPRTVAMPGAAESVRAVTDRGGRAVVVTAKYAPNAIAHLEQLGIEVSAVIGDLWSTAKAAALQEQGAEVYVGDHLGDITGARAADALAVGVATGPISADDLKAAGADVVLADLTRFPAWLESYLLATVH